MLVVPAYKESPEFLDSFLDLHEVLLILVLNRPDSELDVRCNDMLRAHLLSRGLIKRIDQAYASLLSSQGSGEVLLLERPDPLPQKEGVGLARKLGCDIALALQFSNCINSRWIHCSDADARLPEDYFSAAVRECKAVALSYPYRHLAPQDGLQRAAITLYEQHLAQYVNGLRAAGSPYAFYTLGSCLAVDATAYAQVRGFPRRAAGEDFYLLNKLAKLGDVVTPDCGPIRLSARLSDRVPFGTGPALNKLLDATRPKNSALFYHPRCFEELRVVLELVRDRGRPGMSEDDFSSALRCHPETMLAMQELGLPRFLSHAQGQCATPEAFLRQFHQWFDGFKTLKFVHALSATWSRLCVGELEQWESKAWD